MPDKSLLRITRPRETYVDGYGVERTFDEPKVVTKGRKVWDAGKRFLEFLEGDKTWTAPDGEQYPIRQGAGIFEVFDPNPTGKVDDITKLANNLDAIKNTYRKAMLSIKNRRRAWWHEVNAAMNNKRVGGMNYAGDLLDAVPGTKATNKAAARYNAALKAGDSEKAYAARREVEKLTRRDFYDPYVDPDGWNQRVERLINAPFNGGSRRRFEIPEANYYLQPTQVTPKISADDYLDKFKADELRRYQLRRKVNSTPSAQERISRNADKYYPEELIQQNPGWADEKDIYMNRRIYGDDDVLMDIYWRRGDLDGVKHPKVDYTYEDLPF